MLKFRKKEAPPVRGKDISGPTQVKHEGHFGFSDQGFSVRNLPPEWAALFLGINQQLKTLGEKGITKSEAKFLLKEFAKRMPPTVPDHQTYNQQLAAQSEVHPLVSPRGFPSSRNQKLDLKAQECEQLKLIVRNMEEMHRLERKKWMLQNADKVGGNSKQEEEKIRKLRDEKSKLESEVHQLKCQVDALNSQQQSLSQEIELLKSEKNLHSSPSSSSSVKGSDLDQLALQLSSYSNQLTNLRTSMEKALQRTQERLDIEIQAKTQLSEELTLLKATLSSKSGDLTSSPIYTTLVQNLEETKNAVNRLSTNISISPPPPAPAPPPPPPAPGPPPPVPRSGSSAPSGKSPNKPPPPTPNSGGDGRNALLDAIKNPEKQLKKVEVSNDPRPEPEDEGMLGALTRALLDRRAAVVDDEDEDDEEFDWS